jgi:hypothetical protein
MCQQVANIREKGRKRVRVVNTTINRVAMPEIKTQQQNIQVEPKKDSLSACAELSRPP